MHDSHVIEIRVCTNWSCCFNSQHQNKLNLLSDYKWTEVTIICTVRESWSVTLNNI
jgi:hypothetical protein